MGTFGIALGAAANQRNIQQQQALEGRRVGLGERTLELQQQQAQVAQTQERRQQANASIDSIIQTSTEFIQQSPEGTGSEAIAQFVDSQMDRVLETADLMEQGGDAQGAAGVRARASSARNQLLATQTSVGVAQTRALGAVAGAEATAGALGVPVETAARGAGILPAPVTDPTLLPQNFLLPDGSIEQIDRASPTAQEQFAALPEGTQAIASGVTAADIGGLRTTSEASRIQEQNRLAAELVQNLTLLSTQIDENPEALGTSGAVISFTNALSAFPFDTVEFDTSTATTRAMMRSVREAALKTISSDDRFSDRDREAVGRLFPSTGIFESPENAQVKVAVLQSLMLRRLAANQADLVGLLEPSQITDFAIQGLLTDAETIEFLNLIHPEAFD